MLAMTRAVEALGDCALAGHGRRQPTAQMDAITAQAVVGGDAIHPCISAASIIAKEHRDRLMVEA